MNIVMQKDLNSYILTRQELEIMKVVWERGAATVREVWEIMSQTKSSAYTTILTLIQILEKKGALARTKAGRSHIYRPLLTRQQAIRNQMEDILSRFFDGNREGLIESVIEMGSEGIGQNEGMETNPGVRLANGSA
jgi:predicted transcriptional regulator